jgi:hypothetical protein
MDDIVIQLIISFTGVIGSILAVTVILANKLGNKKESTPTNVQIVPTNGTKAVTERFDAHLNICNERWLDNSEFRGKIDNYMVEIRDRLTKLECK